MEPWEVEVFERIKSADEDQSGTINVKELFGVIKGAAEADRQKRLFRRLFIATVVLLLIMLAANMALTAAVVFLAKDTVTNSTGVTMTPSGTRSRLPFQQRSPASEMTIRIHCPCPSCRSTNPPGCKLGRRKTEDSSSAPTARLSWPHAHLGRRPES